MNSSFRLGFSARNAPRVIPVKLDVLQDFASATVGIKPVARPANAATVPILLVLGLIRNPVGVDKVRVVAQLLVSAVAVNVLAIDKGEHVAHPGEIYSQGSK